MSTTELSKMVTTGVYEDLREIDWCWEIKNWDRIQVDESLASEQNFDIILIPGVLSEGRTPLRSVLAKFLVGLKVVDTVMTTVYCKLVKLTGSKTEVPVSFSCAIVNVKDGGVFWQPNPVTKSMKVEDVIDVDLGWTFNQFPIPDADKFLIDGSLKIGVQLRVLLPVSVPSITSSMKQFQEKSAELVKADFGKLLENNQMSDLKIVSSDKKEFPCHRLILSARNPVFATMLATETSEKKSGVINLPDLSGKTVEVLLHYLYTGQLLDTWKKPEVILEFVEAAGRYQITEVLELMDNLLLGGATAPSFLSLGLANKLNLTTAKAELMERIVKCIMNAKTYKELLSLETEGKPPGEKKAEKESEKVEPKTQTEAGKKILLPRGETELDWNFI